jgi:hypothetical protein
LKVEGQLFRWGRHLTRDVCLRWQTRCTNRTSPRRWVCLGWRVEACRVGLGPRGLLTPVL